MSRPLKTILLICFCLMCVSSCKTSHYGTGKHKQKKHRKDCNCPKFSHQDSYPERTYILKTT